MLDNGDIIAAREGADGLDPARMGSVDRSAGSIHDLDLPVATSCTREDQLEPRAVEKSTFAFLDVCYHEPSEDVPTSRIGTYDISARTLSWIVELDPTSQYGQYSLGPGARDVAIGVGNRICNSVAIYQDGVLATPHLTITEGARSFRLDTISDGRQPCVEDAIVNWPAWSPDGEHVAFGASGGAAGRGGPDRLTGQFTIYDLDLKAAAIRPVLAGMSDIRCLEWSVDGKRIVTAGTYSGQQGTWTIAVDSGAMSILSAKIYDDIAFAPDGNKLVGQYTVDGRADQIEVVTLK